jgi:hypothetical protein
LDDLKMDRDYWGKGLSTWTVRCPGCSEQVAVTQARDRLLLEMRTLPVGVAQPPQVEAHVIAG